MEREYGMYFGKFLRERRKSLGLTQEELALKLNVSKSAINKWETGRGIPDRYNMKKISLQLEVPLSEMYMLCEGDDEVLADIGLVNDLINVFMIHGYKLTKEDE